MDPQEHYFEKENLDKNPIGEFQKWFAHAISKDPRTADNMILATCHKGKPSARTLLLKGVDKRGFRFFTNHNSRKSADLKKNPYAALVFNWKSIELQVRVEGKVTRISRKESEEYFHSRPRGSQVASWASPQSMAVPSRHYLLDRVHEIEKKFEGREIDLPPFWGGFILKPSYFEFMYSRDYRLHDRFSYTKKASRWQIERLGP